MELRTVKVDSIIPYENNPRKNDDAVKYVKESIAQCGYISPIIVDENMIVLAGHTRLKAIQELGWKEVEVKIQTGLSEEQKKKYRILDNKTSEFADWDTEKLLEELDGLDFNGFDFGLTEEEEAEAEKKEIVKAEVPFTEVLGEEHNYVVLYFDNEVDWLQLLSIIDVNTKKSLSTRKDGKLPKIMERKGVGRVLKGREVLETLRKHYENIN